MNIPRRSFFGLSCGLLVDRSCWAQAPTYAVWSEWVGSPFEIYGPGVANGLLVYLHEEGMEDQPVALIFAAMARIAQWDVLRINRRSPVDHEGNDARILDFISSRVAHQRREGYDHVIVGGIARGGWLALSAAAVAGVDAVISLAPKTTVLDAEEQEAARADLCRRLAAAKARRIAAFFFDEAHNATMVRDVLRQTDSRFMIVDRAELRDESAARSGRFTRRYRDCLVQFAESYAASGGEVECPPPTGYAVASELGFPAIDPARAKLPAYADPAFGAFWGRWGGDDENGVYVVLETVGITPDGIILRIGRSSGPGERYWRGEMPRNFEFQLDGSRRRVYYRFRNGDELLVVEVKSERELEYQVRRTVQGRFHASAVRLSRHAADAPAR